MTNEGPLQLTIVDIFSTKYNYNSSNVGCYMQALCNNINPESVCLTKLPFEKIHNKFCKTTLGVHKKSSNFAVKCELGRPPVLNFITILALKYFNRLKQVPSDRLLGEVYKVDKSLFIDGHRSWQKFIHNSLQNLNLTSLDFDINKNKSVVN